MSSHRNDPRARGGDPALWLAHDGTVEAIRTSVASVLAGKPEWQVAKAVCWYGDLINTGTGMILDVIVVPAGCPMEVTDSGIELGPDIVPFAVIDVLYPGGWEQEFYDKPDLFAERGVQEYFLYDPANTDMRPNFQGWRRKHGSYTPMKPIGEGFLFSELGFRIDLTSAKAATTPCGPARLEEERIVCRALLDQAMARVEQDARAITALNAKLERLEAELSPATVVGQRDG